MAHCHFFIRSKLGINSHEICASDSQQCYRYIYKYIHRFYPDLLLLP